MGASPGWSYGDVPTAGQWNQAFADKQDDLGFTPVNRAGDTMGGRLVTWASTTVEAGFNLVPGVAPTAPVNGDFWATSAGFYGQANGVTVGPFISEANIDVINPALPGTIDNMSIGQTIPKAGQFTDFAMVVGSIASATTTDLATLAASFVTVTGTVTITGLGVLGAGRLRILTFAAALTLTHNATSLILPGAANIVTAAGDVATMESLGAGNWRCLSYVRASGGTVGFGTSVDNAVVRADGTGGKLQTSPVIIGDTGNVTGVVDFTMSGTATLGGASETNSLIKVRRAGNSIEFGYTPLIGLGSTLGAMTGSGSPFLAFCAGAGTNVNTFLTQGFKGSVFLGDTNGGFLFQTVATASADNQTGTTIAALTAAGAFSATSIQSTPIGSAGASTAAFTTVSATGLITAAALGTTTNTDVTLYRNSSVAITLTATGAQIPAIGVATPGTGAFTTLGASGATTLAALSATTLALATGTIASAATTDLSTVAASEVTVTGSVTINAFGTLAAGALRVLTFSGAPTLTYNATSMILPTAASIVAAAGDVAIMQSLGAGNWKCITYQRATGLPLATASSWQPISTTALSGVALWSQTGLSGFRKLRIAGYVIPVSDGALFLRTSVNNGSSYDAGASDYAWQNNVANATVPSGAEGTATTEIRVNGSVTVGNATGEGISFALNIEQFNQAAYMFLTGTVTVMRDTGLMYSGTISARRLQATARNAIELLFGVGNIADGQVTIEGVPG